MAQGDRHQQVAVAERLGEPCAAAAPHGSFGKRPGAGSFVPDDDFLYYALRGDISRVVAIGKVVGRVYHDVTREGDPGWPWLAPVAIERKHDLISDGFTLDRLDVDRTLTRSVTQKSHIRLTPAEFELARREFGV